MKKILAASLGVSFLAIQFLTLPAFADTTSTEIVGTSETPVTPVARDFTQTQIGTLQNLTQLDRDSLREKLKELRAGNKDLYQKFIAGKKEIREGLQSLRQEKTADKLQDEIAKAEQRQQKLQTAIQAEEDIIQNYKSGNIDQFRDLIAKYKADGDLGIHAFVNGKLANGDVKPFSEDGHTMLPLRAVGEALNAQVSFTDGIITITRGSTTIQLTPDSNTATVNGQQVTIDQPPVIMDGRTFVPVRFISQQLGANVNYIPDGNIVDISDSNSSVTTTPVTTTTPTNSGTVTGSVYIDPSTPAINTTVQ